MLKDTILKFLKLDGFIDSLMGYVETRVELLKIEIKEDLAKSMAKVALILVLAFSFTVFVLFMSVSLAFWIAQSVGTVGGFAAVGGFYFTLAIILVLLRKPLSHSLEKKLIEIFKHKKK